MWRPSCWLTHDDRVPSIVHIQVVALSHLDMGGPSNLHRCTLHMHRCTTRYVDPCPAGNVDLLHSAISDDMRVPTHLQMCSSTDSYLRTTGDVHSGITIYAHDGAALQLLLSYDGGGPQLLVERCPSLCVDPESPLVGTTLHIALAISIYRLGRRSGGRWQRCWWQRGWQCGQHSLWHKLLCCS